MAEDSHKPVSSQLPGTDPTKPASGHENEPIPGELTRPVTKGPEGPVEAEQLRALREADDDDRSSRDRPLSE